MKVNLPLLTVVYGLLASVALAQAPGQPPLPPATDTAAPNIPGVVAGGTKVQVIKDGFVGTEGPIPLPDGTIIFTHPGQSRITTQRQEADQVEVLSGLIDKDRVIIGNRSQFRSGQKVQPKEIGPGAAKTAGDN